MQGVFLHCRALDHYRKYLLTKNRATPGNYTNNSWTSLQVATEVWLGLVTLSTLTEPWLGMQLLSAQRLDCFWFYDIKSPAESRAPLVIFPIFPHQRLSDGGVVKLLKCVVKTFETALISPQELLVIKSPK